MGIIVSLLVSSQPLFAEQTGPLHRLYLANADHIPLWIVMACYSAIAAGTAMGGWRIVRTMGMRITRLEPFSGFCAETGGAVTLLFASHLGVPVSTTHTITGAIVGVGLEATRCGAPGNRPAVWAWTIPAAAVIAALIFCAAGRERRAPGLPVAPRPWPPPRPHRTRPPASPVPRCSSWYRWSA